MATTNTGLHEADLLLASSDEPLLEAEAAAYVADANAPPPLKGKWKSLKHRRIAALRFTLCACIQLVAMIGVGPLLQDLMYTVVCNNIGVAADQCAQNDRANSAVAQFYAWQNVLTALLMLVLVPLVTGISERFGYRAGLLWSGAWLSIELVATYVLIFRVPSHWTYWRMLVLAVIESISGSFITVSNTKALLIFQLFPEPELRPRYTSLSDGLLGASGTFAPAAFSYFGRKYGMDKAFLASAVFLALSVIFGAFMGDLPDFEYTKQPSATETSPKNSFIERATSYVRTQIAGLSVLSFRHSADRATRITAFVLIFNRISTSEMMQGGMNALLMYSKQYFDWDNRQFGLLSTLAIGSITFWGLCGFPLLHKWLLKFYTANSLGIDQLDYRFLLWSTALRLIGFIGIVMSRTSSQLIFWILFKTQSALAGPTMMTAVMKLVPSSEGASFITAVTQLDTVCSVAIPALMLQLYKVTLSWWPKFIFELETVITLLQLLSILLFIKVVAGPNPATSSP